MRSGRDPAGLHDASGASAADDRNVGDLSDRLIEEMETLRRLEGQARELPVGSSEFERVSQEITDRVRGVFMMSARQEALGTEIRQLEQATDGLPPEEDGDERAASGIVDADRLGEA